MPIQRNLTITSKEGLSISLTYDESDNTVSRRKKDMSISVTVPVSIAILKLNWNLVGEERKKLLADEQFIRQLFSVQNVGKIGFTSDNEVLVIRNDETIDWSPTIREITQALFQYEERKRARISRATNLINQCLPEESSNPG
ncbi:MAG: hypothetical protein WC242_01025 [Candidatus Paceibacterota bacterium]